MLCVFKDTGGVYRLGVIGNLCPMFNSTISIYKWTGGTICDDNGCYTPEFLYFAKKIPLDFGTVWSNFTLHEYTFDLSNPIDLFFVNMVSSHPEVPMISQTKNPIDRCFEMSKNGPDVIVNKATMHFFQNSIPQTMPHGKTHLGVCDEKKITGRYQSRKSTFLWGSRYTVDNYPSKLVVCLRENPPTMKDGVLAMLKRMLAVPFVPHVMGNL